MSMDMPKPSSSPRKIRGDPVQAALERVAEAQEATEAELRLLIDQVRELAGRVDQLAEAQRRTEERIVALVTQMTAMASRVNRMDGQLGNLVGRTLEQEYRERAHAYFDDLLAGIRVLSPDDVARLLDAALTRGAISRADRRDALYADVILHGRRPSDQAETYLVAEVSASISGLDTARATRRSDTLKRATGLPVVAAVAGERIHPDADHVARAAGLWRVLDGVTLAPSDTVPAERLVGEG